MASNTETFDLLPGRVLAHKYRIVEKVGVGWEGEVYRVLELKTEIERAAKLFYPERNVKGKAVVRYARKLNRLRSCDILVQYLHYDETLIRRRTIALLVSEYVEGQQLGQFIRHCPGRRMGVFEALNALHSLAKGVQAIHAHGDYHGDIHTDNILVKRAGVGFHLKLIDFYDWGRSTRANRQEDVLNLLQVLCEMLGGWKRYNSFPPQVKKICRGLKRNLVSQRYDGAGDLIEALDALEWDVE
ncbi:MAG: protein kinase [Candidatus Omnitrophica bacterium]|nr:protein kinase [Candidatus Omnitrophota bacterium]